MNDLVSVIITTYKRSELLPRAIDSVLQQTYENIEVIIVDDNDPDSEYRRDTAAMIQEKYGSFQNLFYIKMPRNSGACVARNYGVEAARGKYINFLDDDDEFFPLKIEKQVNVFRNNIELSVVGCFAEIVDSTGSTKGYEKTYKRGNAFYDQLCQNLTTTSLALIKKEVYLKSGGFEQMHSSQEHWMFAKIYNINPYYDFVPEILVKLHHHSGERISTNPNKPLGAIELSERIKSFYGKLTDKQKLEVSLCMNENIISAYLNQGDIKNARKYYRKRLSYGIHFSKKEVRIAITCLFGIYAYRKFRDIFLNV